MPLQKPFEELQWNLDIDRFINPFIVPPPIKHLPRWAARFLGCHDHPPRPLGSLLLVMWSFIGTLAALSLIFVVCRSIPLIEDRGGPLILGSFGAAAVLEFYAIDSPLSQPRNMILGQLISSVIGVGINTGLAHVSSPRYPGLRWLAGTLSCACSMAAMGLTNTVHPPAGATAFLAVTDDGAARLGWALVPVVMLSCALMLAVALLVNNVQGAFPAHWWTAREVGSFWARRGRRDVSDDACGSAKTGAAEVRRDQSGSGDIELGGGSQDEECLRVTVTKRGIFVPPDVLLRLEERLCLEGLRQRL